MSRSHKHFGPGVTKTTTGMARILHVVTAVPPQVCGVGDYGAAVNAKLIEEYGFQSELWTPRADTTSQKSVELGAALSGVEAVILEYSLYAYQRYGIPRWMLRTLADWKTGHKRLVTIFHELFATGMPWSTAFWTSAPQQYVSRAIARLSDGVVTTTEPNAKILRNWSPEKEPVVLAVPSNIGELPALNGQRENSVVVFGLSGSRRRAYLNPSETWAALGKVLGKATLHDVGPPVDLPLEELTGLPCVVHGEIPPAEVSSILSKARWGVIDYSRSTLPKSGVFAAFCAHGVAPIVLQHSTPPGTGLQNGREFVDFSANRILPANPEEISRNAYAWYRTHSVGEHARAIHRLLGIV